MPATLNVPLPVLSYDAGKPGEFIVPRGTSGIKNVMMNRFEMKKRPGTTSLGATAGERIQALFEFEQAGVTYLLRVGDTKVELLNKGAGTWSDVANAALTGTDTDRVDWAFPLLTGARISAFSNGIDNIRKYTGTGNDADLGGTPPKAKYLTWFGGYMLIAGVASFAQRVQWSDTGDPEEWVTGNAGSLNLLDDKESITGLSNWGRYVTVHKSSSIYVGQVVTTSEVFRFDRKATGVGTVNHFTIQELPTGEQIFLAKDGIRLFNGITAPLITAPINDEIREELNPAYIGAAWSVVRHDLNEYWVAVPIGSATTPNTIYKYNYLTGQAYKDERVNISAANTYLDTNETTIDDLVGTIDAQTWRFNDITLNALNPVLILGGTTGIVTRENSTVSNDNGTAIDAFMETKDFTAQDYGIPDFGVLMRWKGIENWFKGNTVTLYYSTDSGATFTQVEKMTLSTSYPTDSSPLISWFDTVSTKIRYRWRNQIAGESFTMKKFSIYAVKRGRRK